MNQWSWKCLFKAGVKWWQEVRGELSVFILKGKNIWSSSRSCVFQVICIRCLVAVSGTNWKGWFSDFVKKRKREILSQQEGFTLSNPISAILSTTHAMQWFRGHFKIVNFLRMTFDPRMNLLGFHLVLIIFSFNFFSAAWMKPVIEELM